MQLNSIVSVTDSRVFPSCNNVALILILTGSWSELQRDTIPAKGAKQEFRWETKFIPESKPTYPEK